MSIESTSPVTEQATDDAHDIYVILWFWRDQPGGGVADWFTSSHEADNALFVLEHHGDPSKSFKLVIL